MVVRAMLKEPDHHHSSQLTTLENTLEELLNYEMYLAMSISKASKKLDDVKDKTFQYIKQIKPFVTRTEFNKLFENNSWRLDSSQRLIKQIKNDRETAKVFDSMSLGGDMK